MTQKLSLSLRPILTLCTPQEIHITWAGYEYRFYQHMLDWIAFPESFRKAPHRGFLSVKNSCMSWDKLSISAKKGE